MFLSRLQLNPAHPQARRDLASAYELHRSLVRAFAPDDTSSPPRFLWRRELGHDGLPGAVVLVQSTVAGRWEHMGGALTEASTYFEALHGNKPVALEKLVQAGRQHRFRLLANPTVKREGKRHGLRGEEAQQAWLQRQGTRHGFEVLGCHLGGSGKQRALQGKQARLITLDVVLFEGVLRCTDAAALERAWLQGIGPGKAMGLGMLSLAPMPTTEVS